MYNEFEKEVRYRLLKLIESEQHLNQRQMTRKMGVSLGKVNYCLTGLIDQGFVRMERFRKSDNRFAYVYSLTPAGIEEKVKLTAGYLKKRIHEYNEIKKQIQELAAELEGVDADTELDAGFRKIVETL